MKWDYSISVITPVYNEGEAIIGYIEEITNYLQTITDNYELILIESGSTDNSGEICDRMQKENHFIKTIHEGKRNGFGAALKLGYRNAVNDLVWLVTVDIPFALETIEAALPLLSENRAVLSYRSDDPRKLLRKIQSFVYNKMISVVLRLRVKHVNSAFKLYRREDVLKMNLISDGWFIDAEMIYWLQYLKLSYTQIPVPLVDRVIGQSTVSSSTFIKVLKEMRTFLKQKKYIVEIRDEISINQN